MKTKISLSAILFITIIVISCKKYNLEKNPDAENYSETPTLPENPYNYNASTNDDLATLGRVLFYDKNLSLNNSVSCASCHQQSKAFSDNLQFSVGLEDQKTPRNSPSIFAKEGKMFWDGRASDLSSLVLNPIKNHVEMKFENLTALVQKISRLDYYPNLFQNAYGSTKIDTVKIGQALTEFISNFNFSNNKFNRSLTGTDKLTASETVGKQIFFGKGQCSNCHHLENDRFSFDTIRHGYGFTDFAFNIGLETSYADNGRGAVTRNSFENGSFMVPVLLNVEYTAPYMHDGRFKTLEEVVEHYNSGIKNHPNLASQLRDFSKLENMSEAEMLVLLDLNHDGEISDLEFSSSATQPIKLNLTMSEKKSLVDFLKTLSDPRIFSDIKFNNPFTKQ